MTMTIDRSKLSDFVAYPLFNDLAFREEVNTKVEELTTQNGTSSNGHDQSDRQKRLEQIIEEDFAEYEEVFKALA